MRTRQKKKKTASDLRHRVILQTLTVGQDNYGGMTETWSPVTDTAAATFEQTKVDAATVWAAIEPLRGREYWDAQQANSEVAGKVIIRHRAVNPTMRILFGSRVLQIESIVHPQERKEFLELLYKEIQD